MKRLFLLSAALIALAGPSFAADMPIKAKALAAPANPFQYPVGNGFYFGVGTIGGGGAAHVNAPGINSAALVTNQIGVAGIAGYVWNVPNSAMFTAVEGWFGWQNVNGSTPGFSFSGPGMFKQRVLVGAPVEDITAFFPSLTIAPPPFPVLPPGQAITTTKAYLGFVLDEDDISANFMEASNHVWQVSPGITVGALALLTKGTALDAFAEVKFADRAICVGSTMGLGCGRVGTTYLAGLALKW